MTILFPTLCLSHFFLFYETNCREMFLRDFSVPYTELHFFANCFRAEFRTTFETLFTPAVNLILR